jgi:hypothetical protein
MRKITLFDEFLVLLGPIISRLFTCSNGKKINKKHQRVLALVLSLWTRLQRLDRAYSDGGRGESVIKNKSLFN